MKIILFQELETKWNFTGSQVPHLMIVSIPYTVFYHMYSDRQAWANSVDPDETPQNAASHLGLHCLQLIQQFLDTTSGSELYWFKC